MKPDELARICVNAINNSVEGKPKITVKLPESKRASKKRYPFGRKGPVGTAVAFGFGGYDTVIFDAVDMLAFLVAEGVVKMEANHAETN